jgi:adenosylcobinamide-phosphate synthase
MIVGRDTKELDEAGICRAAIESLAESLCDGIVAPMLWIAVAGLPGGIAYKAINTADSMIGHKTPLYIDFGWAAARSDDVANWPAARLAVLWLALGALFVPGASPWRALAVAWRDAGKHASPNAGWPEAAMAGALGLRLMGPRSYEGERVAGQWMGDGRFALKAADIQTALDLYRAACGVQLGVLAILLGLTFL